MKQAGKPIWKRALRPGKYSAPGTAPGTLRFDPEAPPPEIRVVAYGPDAVEERALEDADELSSYLGAWPVVWVNVDGIGEEETLRAIAGHFELHPLALEDVVNTGQRAKVEAYEEDLFLIARMPTPEVPVTEQLSLFLGRSFVLTFQERPGDVFDEVRQRIRNGKGRIRGFGPDYLAYAILDAVVDSYFPVLERLGEELEEMEEEVLRDPTPETVARLHETKRALVALRKAVFPHRELLNSLLREEGSLIRPATILFLRDCYDHAIRIIDLVEAYRELSVDLLSTYLSVVSNRMNEVMKVLTIIATIFIPLGFIAGVYGMNFNPEISPWNMPELNWAFGYPFALGVMAAVAFGFVIFIWRRGWFR